MPKSLPTPSYLILAVEESASSLAFYNPDTGAEVGRVSLSLWPHEIAVASDGLAYVSNFGVRDYDLSLGYAGNSVSVIDIAARAEKGRLFTRESGNKFWAPHGVKVSPDERYIYVNVERVLGTRLPDLDRPGSEFTKLLKFERTTGACVAELGIPLPEYDPRASSLDRAIGAYDVVPGTHNFIFSPHNPDELWLFSGRAGVSVFNVKRGVISHRLQSFNGAVRSLSFGASGKLLVSATNEVSLVDPDKKRVIWTRGDLGVGQILYSTLTPDENHILAPAVWEGQVLVISTVDGGIVHRITTGIDPVQVVVSPDEKRAYVTHGRTQWLSYIDLSDLSKVAGRIAAKGGPNGVAFAPWSSVPTWGRLTLVTCLPFTGIFSAEGRELRLGYQHWQDKVNAAGGIVFGGKPLRVEIEYVDTGSTLDSAELCRMLKNLISTTQPAAVLGSYPSAADAALGRESVEAGVPYITGVGTHETLFQMRSGLAFSLAPFACCRLEGVLKAIRHRISPPPRSVALLVGDRSDLVEEALTTIELAKLIGFEVISPQGNDHPITHQVGASDIQQRILDLSELAPDLLLLINDPRDAIATVQAMAMLNFRPGGVGLACDLTNPATLEKMGPLAVGLLSGVPWVPKLVDFAEDRFGSGEDFARGYFDEFSEAASGLSAAGSGVGVIIEKALTEACALADLPVTLAALNIDTFYAAVEFDENGRNFKHPPAAVQIGSSASDTTIDIVWPLYLAGAKRPRWPY